MHPPARTIVIIGGGFSGTVLAANLLRCPAPSPTRIVLIERREQLGWGVAYGPGAYPFLLNVPAGRMSASSSAPAQFSEFARARVPGSGADSYLPRERYGEYLQDLLRSAQRSAPSLVRLECLRAEATAVRAARDGGQLSVELGQQLLTADQIVLACGDPPPALKPYAAQLAGDDRYVRDPYGPGALDAMPESVVYIGAGLTMVDLAVAAAARNPRVRLLAVSRHGLLPQPQLATMPSVLDPGLDLPSLLLGDTTRRLLAQIRALTRTVQAQGGDWREVITRLRPAVPQLWHGLGEAERRRFLRHVRAYWDVHRHRMPPACAERLRTLIGSGQLVVHAGSVQQLRAAGDRLVVTWRRRGSSMSELLHVEQVVECSGTERRLHGTRDPLWRQMLEVGLATADANGLGLRTGPHGALIERDGRTSGNVFYLGPMLRADHWEATAASELRARAEALAAHLQRRAARARAAPGLAIAAIAAM